GQRRPAIADLDAAIAVIGRPHPDLYLERARLQIAEGDHAGARAGLDGARARLGGVASLELFAIELELAEGRPTAADARLGALQSQYADAAPLAGLSARIAAAGGGSSGHSGAGPIAAAVKAPPQIPAAAPVPAPGMATSPAATVTRGPYLQVGTADAVTVRWRTSQQTNSEVRFGTSPGILSGIASDAVTTIEHEMRLSGLSPGTRYYYSVGTSTETLAGDSSYTFQTAPTPGSTPPVRLWAIGDSGSPTTAAAAVRDAYAAWTGARGTDLWLMLGDNAYSSGTDTEYQVGVFNQYPQMLRQSVLWPTRGNHDDLHGGPFNDYYEIFTMPAAAEAGGLVSGTESYYAFDWANIHFVCLDSEGSDRSPGGAMLTWLANDLAANTRPWVIAFWHHPPYSKGSHDSDSETSLREMRQNALPILEAGGVDLVLTGHSHSYERSFMLNGHYGLSNTLTPAMVVDGGDGRPGGDGAYVKPGSTPSPNAGAVHVVAGCASSVAGGPLNHPVMVTSLNLWGSMAIDIHRNQLAARFLSHTGAVLDSFEIVKSSVVGADGDPPTTRGVRLGPG
ncbi:MAG: metallophosphoesterase, partial [Candidatus Eiseniibacteriota bacterium]